MAGRTIWEKRALAGVCLAAVVNCTPLYRDHGYVPLDEDLATIDVGRDTKDSVLEKVGAPSTAGLLEDSGYYYVSSRVKTVGAAKPKVIDRQIVAITFSSNGVVRNIERFGLEDGRVVPLSRRVTDDTGASRTFLRQLIGNLGRFSAADFLNGS